ncbi:MAG: hypothetical protein ACP5N7_01035 [Candidatus Pacearchaeota archaeon]
MNKKNKLLFSNKYKDASISLRISSEELEQLRKIAYRKTGGNVSLLLRSLLLKIIKGNSNVNN